MIETMKRKKSEKNRSTYRLCLEALRLIDSDTGLWVKMDATVESLWITGLVQDEVRNKISPDDARGKHCEEDAKKKTDDDIRIFILMMSIIMG